MMRLYTKIKNDLAGPFIKDFPSHYTRPRLDLEGGGQINRKF